MPSYNSTHSGSEIDNTIDQAVLHSEILNLIYPVGSIYLSVNSTDPSTFIGGTWERIQDTFLLGAGSTYTAGGTGGSIDHTHTYAHTHTTPATTTGNHTLAVGEIPKHRHIIRNASGANTLAGGRVSPDGNSWCFDDVPDGSAANGQSGKFWAWDQDQGGGAHNHPQVATTTDSQSTSTTSSGNNLPPYLAVYIWKRVA